MDFHSRHIQHVCELLIDKEYDSVENVWEVLADEALCLGAGTKASIKTTQREKREKRISSQISFLDKMSPLPLVILQAVTLRHCDSLYHGFWTVVRARHDKIYASTLLRPDLENEE